MLVEQVEKTGNALVDAVLKECVRRQIGKTLLDGIRDDPACTGDRLPSGFEHEREAHGQAGTVGPMCRSCIGHMRLVRCIRMDWLTLNSCRDREGRTRREERPTRKLGQVESEL